MIAASLLLLEGVLDDGFPVMHRVQVLALERSVFILLSLFVLGLHLLDPLEVLSDDLELDELVRRQLRVLDQVLLLVVRVVGPRRELL